MKTKFDKDVEWLLPFFESVSDLVPIQKVKRISSYKIARTRKKQSEAGILRARNNKSFNITIRTYSYTPIKRKGKKIEYIHHNYFLASILDSLAHELSHILHWNHTVQHYRLQAQIMVRFADVLEALNIKDTWARSPISTKD